MPSHRPTALVTGATGFIGWHVVRDLVSHGWNVRAFVRPESQVEHLRPLGVQFHVGTFDRPGALGAAVRGVEAVVHLAGVLLGRDEEAYRRVHVDGTMDLLDAVQRHAPKVRRFVFMSSVAAHGPTLGPNLPDEDAPPHPTAVYGRTKLEAEAEVLERDECFPVTILRPSLVYGPRDRSLLPYFQVVRAGIMMLVEDGSLPISLVYAGDLAAAVRLCLEKPHANGSIYFVADEPPRRMRDLAEAIRDAEGTPAMPFRVPSRLLKLGATIGRQVLRRAGRIPDAVHPDWVAHLLAPGWTCSAQRIRDQLGWEPKTPLPDGLRETVRFYRDEGWLLDAWPPVPMNPMGRRASNAPRS